MNRISYLLVQFPNVYNECEPRPGPRNQLQSLTWVAGTHYQCHHYGLAGCTWVGSWNQKPSLSTLMRALGILTSILTSRSNACPCYSLFLIFTIWENFILRVFLALSMSRSIFVCWFLFITNIICMFSVFSLYIFYRPNYLVGISSLSVWFMLLHLVFFSGFCLSLSQSN